MKKFLIRLMSFVLILGGVMAIASCGGNKTPTTPYEKVKTAFDGVEKSFKNIENTKNARHQVKNRKGGSNPENALSTLYGLYTSEDRKGSSIEDLSYNQPPMIQFQYIKKVLEKVGNNYSFGTKYYDTITGSVYIDLETGLKTEGEANRFSYNFILSMAIAIDDNNLITADVNFDISLTRGSETYHTIWYVCIELDYDMENKSPNYSMAMFTMNNEKELPYIGGCTYEYDYVDVNNSAINEWRQFSLESSDLLVKDATHQDFEDYLDSTYEYGVNAFAWYRNGSFYKNNELSGDKKLTFAKSLYGGLGLNDTEIEGQPFIDKAGTQNNVIKTCYNDFSRIYGDDIIYDLVTTSEHEDHGGEQQEPVLIGISVKSGKSTAAFDHVTLNGDPTLIDALDVACSPTYWGDSDSYPMIYPMIYLLYSDNGREEGVSFEGLFALEYTIEIANNSAPIDLNSKISDSLLKLYDSSKTAEEFNLIISVPRTNIFTSVPCRIGEEILEILGSAGAKKEIQDLGFPLVENPEAIYEKSGDEYIIKNISDNDAYNNYRAALLTAGFAEVNQGNVYGKITDDDKLLQAEIRWYKDGPQIFLKVRTDLSNVWNQELVSQTLNNSLINLFGPSGSKILFEYITTGDYKRVIVYGLTVSEKEAYFSSLNSENQFITDGFLSYGRVLRIIDTANNKLYELPIIDNYDNLEISLSTFEAPFITFEFSVNGGERKAFTPSYGPEESNISYNSEVLHLKAGDVIVFYGTEGQPLEFVEVGGAGLGDFVPMDSLTIVCAPHVSEGYYVINYYQSSYDDTNRLWVQFFNAKAK